MNKNKNKNIIVIGKDIITCDKWIVNNIGFGKYCTNNSHICDDVVYYSCPSYSYETYLLGRSHCDIVLTYGWDFDNYPKIKNDIISVLWSGGAVIGEMIYISPQDLELFVDISRQTGYLPSTKWLFDDILNRFKIIEV